MASASDTSPPSMYLPKYPFSFHFESIVTFGDLITVPHLLPTIKMMAAHEIHSTILWVFKYIYIYI